MRRTLIAMAAWQGRRTGLPVQVDRARLYSTAFTRETISWDNLVACCVAAALTASIAVLTTDEDVDINAQKHATCIANK